MKLLLNHILNKEKIIFLLMVLWGVAPFESGQAIEIEGTGIDWEVSTMQVEFTPENTVVPDFSCFDIAAPSDSSDGPCTAYGGPSDHCVWSDLDSLGYSDENSSPVIDNCFQQAGDYVVTVELTDFASNTSDPEVSTFTVMAGSPDQDQSVFDLTNCAVDDENLNGFEEEVNVANGSDVCTLLLKVRDQYGNPVTQLKSYASAKVYSDSDFPTDANTGISFRDGIRLAATDLLGTTGSPTTFTLSNTDEVSEQFQLSAWAPSTNEVAAYLGKNEAMQLDLNIELPSILSDGSIDTNTANNITFQYEKYSPDIRFRPPARTQVSFLNNPEFIVNVATPMELARVLTPALNPPGLTGPISGSSDHSILTFLTTYLTYHGLPIGLNFSAASELLFDPNDHDFFDAATNTIDINPMLEMSESGAEFTDQLSFSTEVEYDTSVGTVRYPSGALGAFFGASSGDADDLNDTPITARLVGVSIEGDVLATTSDSAAFADAEHLLLGGVNFRDVRESIFKNASNITRGVQVRSGGGSSLYFDKNWFGSSTVALVSGDVYITEASGNPFTSPAEDVDMPVGKNTLVIENGNLYIEDNMVYTNGTDSFGVIMLNDSVEPYPNKGNIFVRTNVQKMVGTYFLEGGFMTNDRSSSTLNTNETHHGNGLVTSDKQLLLEGSILSHNTIGGALPTAPSYRNPWGASGETGGVTSEQRAMAYDMHYIRRFAPLYPPGGGAMTNTGSCFSNPCDTNLNAFVIRIDGKAGSLAPPGFENVANIGR